MYKYVLLEKMAIARERERKCVLKSDSNSDYSEMTILTLFVLIVPADSILATSSASFFFSTYFGLTEIRSQVMGMSMAFSC